METSGIAERQVERFRAFLNDYVTRFREADHADWLYTEQEQFACPCCGGITFSPTQCAECGVIQ